MNAPRVLVLGSVLGQPMGGVRRHAAELLPRVAALLEERGGGLAVLEGTLPISFALPTSVERLASAVPPGPPIVRATLEGPCARRVLSAAAEAGRPFDLVHTAHLPAPRSLPLPYSVTLHDLRALDGAHTPLSRRLIANQVVGTAVRRAAAVMTVSEHVRLELLERFHLDGERVHVVPNAADHLAVVDRPTVRSDAAGLLHVGHLERRKNLELLLRALARAPELPDLDLIGASKHGEDKRLRALADELGVGPRVHLRGALDDVALTGAYSSCAAVVVPSRLEGFGIPALEAMVTGAPLAIARAGALPEVAGPDVPSFEPDDVAGCVNAIRRALATPAAVLELRRAEALERYSWQRSAQALCDVWLRVLHSSH